MKGAESFSEFMTILRAGIFKEYPLEANVVAMMMMKFRGLYRKYPVQTESRVPQSSSWVMTKIQQIFRIKPKDNILAETFGVIVNGADKIPDTAMATIHELFAEGFRVSRYY